NQTAATVLIPADWRLDGGVVWRWNAFYPVALRVEVANPKGLERLAQYPDLLMVDGIRESSYQSALVAGPEVAARAAAAWPEGSNYMGSEVRRLTRDPASVVTQLFVPRSRPDLARARVAGAQELPEVAKAAEAKLGDLPGRWCRVARVRFAYDVNGSAVEEDLYCTVVGYPAGVPGVTFWNAEVVAYRAAAGTLDATMPLFMSVSRSAELDLKWYAGVLDVARQMQDGVRQGIEDAGRLSRYIAKRNDEVSQMIRRSYEDRQRANDRVSEQFGHYIRGTQRYTDPYDRRPVDLPSGYDHVYRNARGEYLMTNDALYDPNVALQEEWRRVTPAGR
ncbi:MAG TPA: hypothetical protein VF796_08450, partial [Humisphaera sp.]